MASLVAPVIPETQNPIESLFKGYAAVASINNRRRQMELGMEKMAFNQALQESKFDLDRRELALDTAYKGSQLELKERGLSQAAENLRFKQGIDDQQIAASTEMMGKVNSLDVPRHSPEWRDKIGDILLESGGAAMTPEYKQLQSQLKAEKDPAFRTRQITFDTRLENLGLDKKSLYTALENPDVAVKTDASAPDKVFLFGGKQFVQKKDAQGVTTYDEQPIYMPIEKKTWDTLRSGYQSLYGKGGSRPAPEPGAKVLDADTVRSIATEIKKAHPDWTIDQIKTEVRATATRNGYGLQ